MLNKEIQKITKIIKEKYKPKSIILFGSYAWGKPSEDSDIDLFLVMDSKLRRDERAAEVSELFSDRLFPLDIIVYTPKEFELSIKRGSFFVKEILAKGKVLYG